MLFCVLKDKDVTARTTDAMVRAEDASKINRIFERPDLATVDMSSVKSEIERDWAEQQADAPETPAAGPMTEQETEDLLDALLAPAPERTAPEKETDEQFLEKLLGASPTIGRCHFMTVTEIVSAISVSLPLAFGGRVWYNP